MRHSKGKDEVQVQVRLLEEYDLESLHEISPASTCTYQRSQSPTSFDNGLPIMNDEDGDEDNDEDEGEVAAEKHLRDYSIDTIQHRAKSNLMTFLLALVPSFLLPTSRATPKKLHPTAYLDGLRGVAAFIVFIHHTILDWFPGLGRGYGSGNPENTSFFMQLPFIRLVYSGRGMVAVFFVISGYVLSYKAIRLMRAGQYEKLLDSLASSTFRRAMRLFIPTSVSTFISMLFCRWEWYLKDPLKRNTVPVKQGDFWFQLHDWWKHVLAISNPLVNVDGRNLYSPQYDGHLWTIPIEFHGSLIIFLTLLCVAKLRPWLRLSFLGGFTAYALWVTHWEVFLFLSGIFLCDLHFVQASYSAYSPDAIPTPSHARSSVVSRVWETLTENVPTLSKTTQKMGIEALAITMAIFATHILTFPDEGAESTPGFRTLYTLTPRASAAAGLTQRFWLSLSAFLLVLAMNFSSLLQYPFTTGVAQYLGKISFALYIVHGPVLYTLGMKMLIPAYEAWVPGGSNTGYMTSCVAAWTVDFFIVIYAADVFWRAVDMKSVQFAGWVATLCWVEE